MNSRRVALLLGLVTVAAPSVLFRNCLSSEALLNSYGHAQLRDPRDELLCDAMQGGGFSEPAHRGLLAPLEAGSP